MHNLEPLDKLLEHLLPGGVNLLVCIVVFWMSVGRNIVMKKDVEEMIALHSPYAKDRQYIMDRLESNKKMQEQLSKVLWKSTEVMNDLKVQIATLAKAIETLEHKMYE